MNATRTEGPVVEECNGWKNYETWAIYSWMLEHDHNTLDYWHKKARRFYKRAKERDGCSREVVATTALEFAIKKEHLQKMPSVTGVYADLIANALQKVDYRRIAEHFIEPLTNNDEA